MGTQRQYNIVLDLQIVRIRQVFNLEEFLHFGNTIRSQVHYLVLFIDNEIAALLLLNPHNGIYFGQIFHICTAGHLSCQNIAGFIQLCGLTALAGNNKGRPGLVNEHRIHLIDNGKVQITKNELLFIDHHIVPQVIKTELIIRHISDIAAVGFSPFIRLHGIQHNAYPHAQKLMYLSHPLRITFGQIIVDSDNMDSLPFQCI